MSVRRHLRTLSDRELAAERKQIAGVAGKYARKRYAAILDEQIRREEAADQAADLLAARGDAQ